MSSRVNIIECSTEALGVMARLAWLGMTQSVSQQRCGSHAIFTARSLGPAILAITANPSSAAYGTWSMLGV